MKSHEMLLLANAAANKGCGMMLSTGGPRQPYPGIRLELMSVGTNGSHNWRVSSKQVLRIEKDLRARAAAREFEAPAKP